jgi:hypothetical protein
MNRELLVTLLRKQIHELDMMTEGFMEMKEYPASIVELARMKTIDIQEYIEKLGALKEMYQEEHLLKDTFIDTIIPTHPPAQEEQDLQPSVFVAAPNDEIGIELTHNEALDPIESEIITIEEPTENLNVVETVAQIEQVISAERKPISTPKDTKKPILADKLMNATTSRNEQLYKADNSISSTIANKKIDDIKQAISLGDRFRFQRELFKGNGEDMNKTLLHLNQIANYDEAVSFLQANYEWKEDDENASDFYQIIRRKFL